MVRRKRTTMGMRNRTTVMNTMMKTSMMRKRKAMRERRSL